MFRRVVVLLLSVLIVLPAVPARAAPAPIDLVGLDFQLVNAGRGWCLTSGLAELPCARTEAYRWRFRPVDATGRMVISHRQSGKCLSMPGGTVVDGARAGLEPCAATPARRWSMRGALGETATIVNDHSGRCLQIEGGVAVQGSCAGPAGARRWTVRVLSLPLRGVI